MCGLPLDPVRICSSESGFTRTVQLSKKVVPGIAAVTVQEPIPVPVSCPLASTVAMFGSLLLHERGMSCGLSAAIVARFKALAKVRVTDSSMDMG